MKKICLALAATATLLAPATFSAEKAVATVNGVVIPQSRVDFLVQQVATRGQKDSPELREKIREDLIRNEIVIQEASKKGLDKSPDVALQLEMIRLQVVFNAYITDYMKNNPVTEADMKKEYDAVKVQFSGKEYRARHILVPTEAEAKTILADLKKGKKFDDLAKTKSKDPGSASNGGDLGWAVPGNYVPEFAEALQKLPKGKVSDVAVKTQFGFHVIKVEDIRDAKGPSYEELQPEIQQELQNRKLNQLMMELRSKAKVE